MNSPSRLQTARVLASCSDGQAIGGQALRLPCRAGAPPAAASGALALQTAQAAFTLVELMVSTAIIGLIMLVLVAMTNQMSRTWRSATEKIEKFQEARDGFEAMTRRLSQATLNTYWDYLDQSGNPRNPNVQSAAFQTFIPFMYGRASDLRFVSGPMTQTFAASSVTALSNDRTRPGQGIFFQAPFGVVNTADAQSASTDYGIMNNLLNTWGYFVEAGYDTTRPVFVNSANVPKRWRSRLMEYNLTSEQMAVYDPTDTSYKWFTVFLPIGIPNRPVRVLAENVLALVILPKLSNNDQDARIQNYGSSAAPLSPAYLYDSTMTLNPGVPAGTLDPASINPKNQLPPMVSVTMIAVDERSAERLADKYCATPNQSTPSLADATMGLSTSLGASYNSLFTNSLTLETVGGDLATFESALTKEGCTYRVFTTNVTIRAAKWSRSQTK